LHIALEFNALSRDSTSDCEDCHGPRAVVISTRRAGAPEGPTAVVMSTQKDRRGGVKGGGIGANIQI
jgi:hypothetical protein